MSASKGKTGVLYVSLGTPDSPAVKDVKAFLDEFLSDPLVVDFPRVLWIPLLKGVILTTRPKRTAKAYDKIWDHERGESPLRTVARAQANWLSQSLSSDSLQVEWAFRYGTPNIEETLRGMVENGCSKILIFALFPQYSQTTVGTIFKEAQRVISTIDKNIALNTVSHYHNYPDYIAALRNSVEADLRSLAWKPDMLLASYHSIPKKYCDNGDPYRDHCEETSKLLRAATSELGLKFDYSYQSRLGRAEWLSPYSINKVAELARAGVKKLMVISPCFAQDNLETLEEIDMELRAEFLEAGGEQFHYVRCLNVKESHMALLKKITERHLEDWTV